jgi:hypothetical protein
METDAQKRVEAFLGVKPKEWSITFDHGYYSRWPVESEILEPSRATSEITFTAEVSAEEASAIAVMFMVGLDKEKLS